LDENPEMKATIETDVRARLAEKMGLLNGTIAPKATEAEDDDEEFFDDDEDVIAEAR
jgi:hypothetical protein